MSEKCPKTGIPGCPYLHDYEIDDIQGCKLSCGAHTEPSLMPTECPLDVCDEIKAAEDKRGKEVLEMICGTECGLCEQHIPAIFEFGSWFHYINDTAYRCKCEWFRQAYQERFGHEQG